MASEQILVRLPYELARRFRRAVPLRQRSKFIEQLLDHALPVEVTDDADPLFQAALAVEQNEALAAEMSEWENTTVEDCLRRVLEL